MPESPETIVYNFVAAINAQDLAALRSLMTENHTFTDAKGNSFSGVEKMLSGWQHFFHAYPEYRIAVQYSFTHGDRVALFGEARGKWRVNGVVTPQTWKVAAAWLAQIAEDKVKAWSVFCDTAWAEPPR